MLHDVCFMMKINQNVVFPYMHQKMLPLCEHVSIAYENNMSLPHSLHTV